MLDNGQPEVAFTVAKKHVNSLQICHGGMLLSFADAAMSLCAIHAIGGKRRGKTARISDVKFSNPAKEGEAVIASMTHSETTDMRRFFKVSVGVKLHTNSGTVLEASGEFLMPMKDDEGFEISSIFGQA